jgi:YD repeat-containing protein
VSPRRRAADAARLTTTLAACLLAVVLVAALPGWASAQAAAIHYVYDDLNRLSAVVNQQGDVAVYSYDAVGNILRIERFDASGLPGAVGISYFAPAAGVVGTVVQVFGKGFSPTAGQNTLTFNGTPAVITSAAPNRLVVSVPAGATTGPLGVTTPLGSAASATAFVVIGTLAVAPGLTDVQVGLTRQFDATEDGAPTTNVNWSVNGVVGGDTSVGTISTTGLYTAPGVAPVPPTATVGGAGLGPGGGGASGSVGAGADSSRRVATPPRAARSAARPMATRRYCR